MREPGPDDPVTLTLDGSRIDGIAAFYDQINRVFMADEDWALGHSLDGLNDMLHGGYGATQGHAAVTIVWQDMARCRDALGVQATRDWLMSKMTDGRRFNAGLVQAQLDALDRGDGQTFFQIVMDIFADHPRFRIVAR